MQRFRDYNANKKASKWDATTSIAIFLKRYRCTIDYTIGYEHIQAEDNDCKREKTAVQDDFG